MSQPDPELNSVTMDGTDDSALSFLSQRRQQVEQAA
jgi:hypothetical protein